MDSKTIFFTSTSTGKHTKFHHFVAWCVLLFCTLILSFFSNAVPMKTIKKLDKMYTVFGVVYDTHKDEYYTFSRISGETEVNYDISDPPKIIKTYSYEGVSISLATYPEFYEQIVPLVNEFESLKELPKTLFDFLTLLKSKRFDLNTQLVFLPTKYGIFYKSKTRSASNKIELVFFSQITEDSLLNHKLESRYITTISHELFHFLAKYLKLPRMNELRDETFASLAGGCISYELTDFITSGVDILEFSPSYFQEPNVDIKKIRKKVKRMKYLKSRVGKVLSKYYFQAIANDHTGENITSDKIPKFCHKLFSERNFKYPIEKKTPPWFKEFLGKNRQALEN